MTTPLLATKLYIPSVHPNLVPRPRLIEQLNTGTSRKLTLISAPAGFGKSTLLSSWAAQIDSGQIAWLSLDEGDSDFGRFFAYFIAALQTKDPDLGKGLVASMQSLPEDNQESILIALINEIATSQEKIILILDDYHVIETPAIDQALTFLIEHLPPQLRMVIASRIDPTLPLARLRARREMAEIRVNDLRFTLSETTDFLNHLKGFGLSNQDVRALGKRTEGWVAGLQLAALSIQSLENEREISEFVNRFTGSDRYIQDYLVDEVLRRQPTEIQEFLLRTAILARLSGPLCDRMRFGLDDPHGTPSQEILENLETANLFIIPLDNERCWYRYHHLFKDLVRHRLQTDFPELVPELHRRASIWHENEGDFERAFLHAQAADDTVRATDILERHWQDLLHLGEMNKLKRWLDKLEPGNTRKSAPLNMAYCWVHHLKGEISPIPGHLQAIRDIWQESDFLKTSKQPVQLAVIPSLVESMEAIVALDQKRIMDVKSHAQAAISLIPDDPNPATHGHLYGVAGFRLGLAHVELGESEQAIAVFLEILEILKNSSNFLGVAQTILQIVSLYQDSGKTQAAINLCERYIDYFATHNWDNIPSIGTVYIVYAGLQADSGNFDIAREYLVKGQEVVKPIRGPNISTLERRVQEKFDQAIPANQLLVEPLSERELDVLRLIAQGLTNREISERLYLAIDTIKGHNRRLFGKLDVHNRTEAVNRARKLGLL
jgi:LuxR family maltose regulon positive regulatory protein